MKNTIYVALLAAAVTVSPLVAVAGPAAAAANVYYVAPNGNDSAAGTRAAPWATIARAQTAAKAGDTVYLRVAGTPTPARTAPVRARRPESTRSP